MEKIILIVLFTIFPVVIIYVCHKFPAINKLGAIAIAYGFGIIVGNIGIIPEGGEETQIMLCDMTVPIAIPLLLFSLDIKKWIKHSAKAFSALFLGLISVITMIIVGFFIFRGEVEEMGKVGGLLTGVYTGGSPNLASIKTMLDVDEAIFIATNTYDIVLCAILFLFLVSFAQKVFGWILPAFKKPADNLNKKDAEELIRKQSEIDSYQGFFRKKTFFPMLMALGLSLIILGLGFLIWKVFSGNETNQPVIIILSITTLGILASLIPRISKIKKSFQLGMYFIIVFSFVVASRANISDLVNISKDLFLYVAFAVFGSLILHLLLSKLFKVDTDTFIIVTTALCFSPPFVPAVAAALKNKDVIITGLVTGLIGYALGNYLGYTLGTLLSSI